MRNAHFLPLVVVLAACAERGPVIAPGPAAEIASPAGDASGEPHLAATSDGRVLMSWLERTDASTHAVRFASWDGAAWSQPRTIAEGADFFVNWADFPSILDLGDGRMAAHWLQRSGQGRYAYGVRIARSNDGGASWSAPVTPHHDGTPTEHGFVSLFAVGNDVGAVWLDGRLYDGAPAGEGVMTLRFATVGADGAVSHDALLDERTCDCCQTDAAWTDDGPVVAYRDRSADEIRDISVVRLVDGNWSEPVVVHADGWRIDACPVNGPAIVAHGRTVAAAWFTAAGGTPRVRVAFSADGGATFGAPVQVDAGAPVGRLDLLPLDDGAVLVSWLERTGEQDTEVRVRVVRPDGGLGEPVTVSRTSAERASGFPRMARSGDGILLAWTDPSDVGRVRVARLSLR